MTRIFVYGTLKQGFGNNQRLLRTASFHGSAVTKMPYLMKDTGGFPVVLHSNAKDIAPVKGELYDVDDATLNLCDRLEGHPNWYRREEVSVEVAEGVYDTCWMYIGVAGEWNVSRLADVPKVDGVYEWSRA